MLFSLNLWKTDDLIHSQPFCIFIFLHGKHFGFILKTLLLCIVTNVHVSQALIHTMQSMALADLLLIDCSETYKLE